MTGYFLKPGKYGSAPGLSVVVSEDDVKDEKLFDIGDGYVKYFIEVGVFVAGAPKPPDAGEFILDDMKIDELKAFAEEKEIPLGEAKLKAEILEVITAALEPAE